MIALLAALLFSPAPAQHTAAVCGGDNGDPLNCYNLDTSIIVGRPFEAYRVTNPGAVLTDPVYRRTLIAALDKQDSQRICGANPFAGVGGLQPSVTLKNVAIRATEVPGSADVATLSSGEIATSDALILGYFGFQFRRDRASQTLSINFLAADVPELRNAGLTPGVKFTYSPAATRILAEGYLPYERKYRRLFLSVIQNLPAILANSNFTAQGSTWSQSELIAQATLFRDRFFADPTPILAPDTTGDASAALEFADFLMRYGAEYTALRTANATTALTATITSWARAGALLSFPNLDPASRDLLLMQVLKPLVIAWGAIRNDPVITAFDRQAVEAWIGNLMAVALSAPLQSPDSSGYFAESIRMAWAIIMQDHATFALGVQRLWVGLNQMRGDGSFPIETRRRACALRYQNVATGHLVTLAELATTQGYDLMSLSSYGKDLTLAIQFILDSIADSSRLQNYANAGSPQECESSAATVDLSSFTTASPNGTYLGAYMEHYAARLPFANPAVVWRNRTLNVPLADARPLLSPATGANATCLSMLAMEFTGALSGQFAKIAGDNQDVPAYSSTPIPLTVQFRDRFNNPVAGVVVRFRVVDGNAAVPRPTTLTDSNGFASMPVTAGPAPGGYIIVFAQIDGLPVQEFHLNTVACAYTANRAKLTLAGGGDLAGIGIAANGSACPWTASGAPSWLHFLTGTSYTGGSTVRVQADPNPQQSLRTASITLAGIPITVSQSGGGCSYSIMGPGSVVNAAGATLAFTVATDPACGWSASAAPDWLTIASPSTVTAAANTGSSPRTGSINVAGFITPLIQPSLTGAPVFTDVPATHPFYDYITLLKQSRITAGCTASTYCPDDATTRGQMAVFLIRALLGTDTFPYPSTPFFTDVLPSDAFFPYIQKLRDLGVTGGCATSRYCPDDPVTRGQMAAFLVRARLSVAPAGAFPFVLAPYFEDAPTTHPFFSYIQKMRQLGITMGCTTAAYCPDAPTTRGQMAAFLVRAFLTP
ncbi:MAG: S-layer homology domain-containing protein [Bryobacterales bacterium]|nr:S-layer homology domain-containing protein [Bryobacterales bacterium]